MNHEVVEWDLEDCCSSMKAHPKLQFYLDPAIAAVGVVFEAPKNFDAGFDIRAALEIDLMPGQQVAVPTGLYLAIPEGWVGIVKDRSSMAIQRLVTHAGVIDAGYRGEVKIILANEGNEPYHISRGAKIAQLIVLPHLSKLQSVSEKSELGATERGASGFGSTGK